MTLVGTLTELSYYDHGYSIHNNDPFVNSGREVGIGRREISL